MTSDIKKTIRDFWTENVPGLDIFSKKFNPEQKDFYIEADKFRLEYEPCVIPLLDSLAERGKRILEIGCGLGSDSRYIAKKGVDIVSLDLSLSNVSFTIKGIRLLDLEGHGVCADAEKLPFKDGAFDTVYSFGVLHHTPDTQKAINEIWRILKPKGKCIVMLYHKGYAYFLLLLLYGYKLILGIYNKENLMSKYDKTPLSKMYSKKEAKKLFYKFKELFLETNTYGGIQYNHKLRWVWILFNKVPSLMNNLGSYLIIRAIK